MNLNLIFVLLLITVIAIALWWGRRRWVEGERVKWSMFAENQRMEFLDRELPRDFPSDAMPLFWNSTRFCVAGTRYGEPVFALQFRRGFGSRNTQWVTALGCRQSFPALYQPKNSIFRRLGRDNGWVVLSSSWLLAVRLDEDEVLAAWDAMRTTKFVKKQSDAEMLPGDTVVHPRENVHRTFIRHDIPRSRPTDTDSD